MSPKSKVLGLKSSSLGRTRTTTSRTARKTLDRPCVFVNMAMTADGKIATANRAVSSFGSRRDHNHLLELRATADAVMSGARTVDSAKISMGTGGAKFQKQRLKRGLAKHNVRIIVSGSGSIDPRAEVFKHHFSPIIVITTQRMTDSARRRLKALGVTVKICGAREINFRAALNWLHDKWGVRRLLCEGGGDLNDAMFRADFVDELHLTICPKIFGGRNAPTISDGLGLETLLLARNMNLKSIRQFDDELFLVFCRRESDL